MRTEEGFIYITYRSDILATRLKKRVFGNNIFGETRAEILRGEIDLPEKDWPVLGGAAVAGATHLITGDLRHFGAYFGEKVLGVLVLRPADYLRGLS